MTPEKLKEAFDACIQVICCPDHGIGVDCPKRCATDSEPQIDARWSHLWWMCVEGQELVDAGRAEKAMRWLGFVQGALWSDWAITVDDAKAMNKPDGAS